MYIEITNKIQLTNCLHGVVPSLPSIINNVTKLALPILGMMAISRVPMVKGGINEYLACVQDCYTMQRPDEIREFGLYACLAGCLFYKMN